MAKSTRPLSLLPDVTGPFAAGTVPRMNGAGKFVATPVASVAETAALAADAAREAVLGDALYVHEQTVPATTWTIDHGMNGYPTVTVVDSGKTQVFGKVTYPTSNRVVLTFSAGFSGIAYLNK